ncbi:unnamed protein product [Closterium sp. Naga37s-1]|nr:unnamed protein product [Closterium sp. Naga37s-1]
MLAQHEETRKREFESQPGEVKEAIAAAGGGSAVTPVTAPGRGGGEKGGAPGAPSVEGGARGEEKPSAAREEGAASRGTKKGDDMPTTAAGRMGGGVAAPEVPIRMRDVLPEGEVQAGALDMPVTKMDAAAKQREETAEFGGPVKGGTAAAMQSAADKNVQAGVVPPMGAELASAKAAEATAQGRKLGAP